MAAIPSATDMSELVDRVYKSYERANKGRFRLTRIGASNIGEECARAVWFDWRGAADEQIEGRVLRLFKTGFIQEDRMLEDLKNAGLEVWGHDANGDQWTYTDANGHFVCKLDGVVKGIPGAEKTAHTLEIKTSNKKGFDEMVKMGVQKSKPMHYAQMQAGMHCSGIHRALYIMICKDNEGLHMERVVYDAEEAAKLFERVRIVMASSTPPIRITEKSGDWRCKYCDYKAICWEKAPTLQHCRTCEHSSAVENGEWACGLMNTVLDSPAQLKGCEHWVGIL